MFPDETVCNHGRGKAGALCHSECDTLLILKLSLIDSRFAVIDAHFN